jgi:hypothetical protein
MDEPPTGAMNICRILASDVLSAPDQAERQRRYMLLITACRWTFDDDDLRRHRLPGESRGEATGRLAVETADRLLREAA